MADVLQPAAWNCNLSKYDSLEQLYQVLADAQGCQRFASILADLQTPDIWEELLRTGRAEDAGSIAQHAIIVSLSGEISPESEQALAGFFETVVKISHDHPLTAALVLGGTLSALRSNQSAKKSLSIATRMLQIWFTDTAFEAVIHALIKGIFKDEVAEACGGWLCSVPDRMAQAFGTFNSTCGTVAHFLDWMRSSYSQRLVTALVASLCENPDWDDLAPTSLDLLARVVLRGHRAILAAHLCSKALSGKATVVGQIILKLSEEHVSAGRSLACAMLEASTAVLQTTSTGLVSYGESGNLLAVLRPALKRGLPIQQLLAVHIWQIPLGSQLSPAVVFALVDELMESECSSDVCTYWFNAWADPRHRDLPAEQNLALRVARTLRWQSLVSPNLHLLLQGVQHRLSAQAKTSRLYGMAVAETLASSWMDGKSEGEEKLQFDDFDRDDAAVAAFGMVKSDFEAIDALPLQCEEPESARILCQLLTSGEGPVQPTAKQANPLIQDQPKDSSSSNVELASWPEADSDDEDDDHPLCGVPPLSPLNAPPDTCSDLLLVQPPLFLRSAYEMLLGPLKTPATPLSEEAYGKPGAAPEPAATARARLFTALAELPILIQQGSEELPRLAAPISSRLLRLEAVHDVADLKLEVLVSLLVADSSRRNAVQSLIAEFGREDLPLTSRKMILDALAAASKELSNVKDAVEQSGAPKPALGTVGKTRRFASASRVPSSITNRFASEARHFILPLVARWRQPAVGAATWALGEASIVSEFLHSLGVMLESAGRACPDKERLVRDCIDPAMEGLSHTELLVRRCSLFVLSRIVLVGCEEILVESPKILTQLEACPFVESDDTCRRMAAGLVACLSKHILS